MTNKNTFQSQIVAMVIVSESEIQKVIPNFNESFEQNKTQFESILWELGIDITKPYIKQKGLRHRNRLNEVVKCTRYLGEERLDMEWINSGYASQEAKDKYSSNHILDDLYRSKYLTVDTQALLESRDRYSVIDETVWGN